MELSIQIDKSRIIEIAEEDLDEFVCGICLGIFTDPVVTKCCGQTFCKKCIEEWLSKGDTCPNDRKPLRTKELIPAPRAIKNLLSNLKLKCNYEEEGCFLILRIGNLGEHLKICEFRPGQKCTKCGLIQESVKTHICPSPLELKCMRLEKANEKLSEENTRLKNEKEENEEVIANLTERLSNEYYTTVKKLKTLLNGRHSSRQRSNKPNCVTCGLNQNVSSPGVLMPHNCIGELITELQNLMFESTVRDIELINVRELKISEYEKRSEENELKIKNLEIQISNIESEKIISINQHKVEYDNLMLEYKKNELRINKLENDLLDNQSRNFKTSKNFCKEITKLKDIISEKEQKISSNDKHMLEYKTSYEIVKSQLKNKESIIKELLETRNDLERTNGKISNFLDEELNYQMTELKNLKKEISLTYRI